MIEKKKSFVKHLLFIVYRQSVAVFSTLPRSRHNFYACFETIVSFSKTNDATTGVNRMIFIYLKLYPRIIDTTSWISRAFIIFTKGVTRAGLVGTIEIEFHVACNNIDGFVTNVVHFLFLPCFIQQYSCFSLPVREREKYYCNACLFTRNSSGCMQTA